MVTFSGWGWREKQKDICRSTHPDVFWKKRALKYLAKLTGKQTRVQELFLKKEIQDVGVQLYLKRGSSRIGFFSVKFLKIFRTAFL